MMRSRQFTILAAAAVIGVIGAVVAISLDRDRGGATVEQKLLFPGLMEKLEGVQRIAIAQADGAFEITRESTGAWVMPAKHGYRVQPAKIRQVLLGFASMKTLEAKTKRPEFYAELGVEPVAQEAANSTRVRLFDAGGTVLAGALFGQTRRDASLEAAREAYVRLPDQAQAWLVAGAPDLPERQIEWLAPEIIGIERARIAKVIVEPSPFEEGTGYTILRATPQAAHFDLAGVPQEQTLKYEGVLDGLGNALEFLEFQDVGPAADFDLAEARQIVFRSFGGLEVRVRIAKIDDDYWATFGARFDDMALVESDQDLGNDLIVPGAPADGAAEAAAINRRVRAWVYQLPAYKAGEFFKDQADFLEDIEDVGTLESDDSLPAG